MSFRILILQVESLTKDLVRVTRGLMKWSTDEDIFSVGLPLPETIGLLGELFNSLLIFGNI